MFRDRKAISRFVTLLEQNALVERQVSAQNKATHQFLLTKQGRERMSKMLPLFRSFVTTMSAGIAPKDREQHGGWSSSWRLGWRRCYVEAFATQFVRAARVVGRCQADGGERA